jgi:FkbM family methyltransferase
MSIKSVLKRARRSQPFNNLATSLLKNVGVRSEVVTKHLPRVGITEVKLPNGKVLKLESDEAHWIPNQLFWHGWLGYEPEVTPIFYKLAERANVVIDVGAHFGFFTILAALANPDAKVIAMEPLQRVFERLKQNVELNGLANVECQRVAASSTEGVAEFYFPDENAPVSSSLRSDFLVATIPHDKLLKVEVPVVTLDRIAEERELSNIDLIKLDTERTEHEVLAGSSRILERFRPDIICEVWPDAANTETLEAILKPLGYNFYHLLPEGPFLRNRIIPSVETLNYFFTTKHGADSRNRVV